VAPFQKPVSIIACVSMIFSPLAHSFKLWNMQGSGPQGLSSSSRTATGRT